MLFFIFAYLITRVMFIADVSVSANAKVKLLERSFRGRKADSDSDDM